VHDHDYIARLGWTRRDLVLLPASLLFVAVGGTLAATGQPVVGGLAVVLGCAYLGRSASAAFSRRVAFAVTAEGVTLGQAPPWPASRTAFIPWSEIEAVVHWRQTVGTATVQYVGVQRRGGAAALPGSATSRRLRRLNKALAPANLPEGVVADSRPVTFWRLDKARLARAVNEYAPHVPFIDHG
jgi:hypothetical protein